ncbi:MAG: hypothetical protein WD266_01370 [Balneolales bacterium]
MTNHYNFFNNTFIPAILGVIVLVGAGCDSGVDATDDTQAVTVSGRASDQESENQAQSSVKSTHPSAETHAAVEGAVVTAVAVQADGSVSPLTGEATTDANGEFTLVAEGEGAADHIRVFAQGDGDFQVSTIVQVNGQSSVDARPLTNESHAHAEVYLEAKAEDGFDSHFEGVTAADVSVSINSGVAAAINAGTQSASETGAAIATAVKAQAEYNAKAEAGADLKAVAETKAMAFVRLQADLAAAADAQARDEAYEILEETYVNAFAENGISLEAQAKFHQVFSSILVEASSEAGGSAELGLRQQAELILAQATALAIETMFEAEGASTATLETLAEAKTEVVSEIRAAASEEVIVSAKADYKAKVDAETESHFGISSQVRAEAEAEIDAAASTLQSTLAGLSLLIGDIAAETAGAFTDFYLDAGLGATASFEASGMGGAEAEAAAQIMVMTGVIIS